MELENEKKKCISIKRRIAIIIGGGIAFSNLMLLALLLYNMLVAMSGFQIEINGKLENYYFVDGFEKKLLIAGVIICIITTVLGVFVTSYFVKLELQSLKKLSEHMATVDKYNLVEKIEIETPLKETEDFVNSFNLMIDKVQEAIENQKNLTSFVAHELRTPLTVIQTKIDVYKKLPEKERDIKALVEMLEGQITKLTFLINRTLEFSDIQRTELTDLVPIYILIEEVFDDLEEIADEKNVELKLEKGNNNTLQIDLMDIEIKGNHELLYQAFYNLIENAIKYNRQNGIVDVDISLENDQIYVKISDTGCGIPASEQDRIFEPFYRCKNESTKKNNGNGIGLALVKKVLDHHQGKIYLKDVIDYNNCFEVVLDRYMH